MAGPRAIDTVYLGHRYRSRLEARWAVFMDALGIAYEYEPEGFELPDVGRYLPDFWLPKWEAWVEIKPSFPQEGDGLEKMRQLSWQTMHEGLLIYGQPWPREHGVVTFRPWMSSPVNGLPDGEVWTNPPFNEFAQCRRCDGFNLIASLYHPAGHYAAAETTVGEHTCGDRWKGSLDVASGSAPRIKAAYEAARAARFEFGAKGNR